MHAADGRKKGGRRRKYSSRLNDGAQLHLKIFKFRALRSRVRSIIFTPRLFLLLFVTLPLSDVDSFLYSENKTIK
jgi:hypothetical protein